MALKEAEDDRIRISTLNAKSREDIIRSTVKERPREVPREPVREPPRERSPDPPRERPREKLREKPKEKTQEKPREKPREKPQEKPVEKPREKPLAPENPPVKTPVKPESRPQEKPRETPDIPLRPNRERRKSMMETHTSTIDKFALKREQTKSAQSTPYSSTDSLPLWKEKTIHSSRSTPIKDQSREFRSPPPAETPPIRPLSMPKIGTPTEESSTRKKTDSPFGPKLSFATSSFFKVLKEEFQGKSVRVDEKKKELDPEPEPELESASDSESTSPSESESDSEQSQSTVKGASRNPEQVEGVETSEQESLSESSSETSSSSSSSSSSDSQSGTGPEQAIEEEPKGPKEPREVIEEKADPIKKEDPKQEVLPEEPKPEVLPEEPKTPVLQDTPELPKPRRNLRNTPSPPRPKSVHSRTGSDGSLTPRNSVGSDNRSAVSSEPVRNVSDASTATVQPLRFNKSKKQLETVVNHEPPSKQQTTAEAVVAELEAETEDWYNPEVSVKAPSLKRKYTKHADLISILSVPRSNKSMRSAARSRSGRSKGRKKVVETLTITDLMDELAGDEVRYMREMRTLVEDVVPVLFQTVLGRADDDLRRTASTSSSGTSATASSRNSRSGFHSNPTRPIVDMGITLERLKSLHERIPRDHDQFLMWAGDAKRVYEEYLSVWRMGFQDVVVTMPPAPDDEYDPTPLGQDAQIRRELEILHGRIDTNAKYEGDPSTWAMPPPPVPEEEEQDEQVDVAFLLKRPLVRLKLLAKLLKRINYIDASPLAESLSNSFHALVTMARKKISDEKARIEDEAAASLDVSSVCDMNLLLPRADVSLDQSRRVKARDVFAMRLYHSTGQIIERNVELILRDPSTRSKYSKGEVLIVELGEGTHKWLLFPPVALSAISARTGDAAGEIVVMVRGLNQHAEEWREIMALASSTAAGFEWVQMLGLVPIPPEGPFAEEKHHEPTYLETVIEESIAPSRHQTPVEKPKRKKNIVYGLRSEAPKLQAGEGLGISKPDPQTASSIKEEEVDPVEEPSAHGWIVPDISVSTAPEDLAKLLAGFELPNVDVQKADDDRSTDKPGDNSVDRSSSLHTVTDAGSSLSPSTSTKSVSSITRSRRASRPSQKRKKDIINENKDPSIAEKDSQESLAEVASLNKSPSINLDAESRPERKISGGLQNIPVLLPSPVPEPESESGTESEPEAEPEADIPPPVPPHRSPAPSRSGTPESPPGSPTVPSSPASSVRSGFGGRRRTSSPLKHEYAPSSTSDSGSEHETPMEIGNVMDYQDKSESESESSSEDEESDDAVSLCSEEEDGDYPPPMLSIPRRMSRKSAGSISIPRQRASSIFSSSAKIEDIQAPDTAPPPVPQIGIKFRAFVYKWGTSSWDKLIPGECKIVITPGHIEGFPLDSSSTSSPGTPGSRDGPDGLKFNDSMLSLQDSIFSLDLNPETPIRRGTAVDISIRTPKGSSLAGANIMLRSRSPNECEMLFNGIQSNIHYPADYQVSTMLTSMVPSEMGGTSVSSATFGGSIKRGFAWTRGKTYRAGMSTGTPSLVSTPSETSVGSIASAFSRFRGKGIFKNSSLSSVASSATTSMMGDGSRGGTPTELSNLPGIENGFITMAPMKVRLYLRETPSKWRDLGNARLNVLNPPDTAKNMNDKRVVITNKKGNLILLDTVLGEQSFERVARTGIAISILTSEGEADGTGKPGDIGGIGAKNTVYMMQMKGEAEAAYSFSILGKLRY
ncbi:hypothetical protein EDC01DRAFT_618638 [Geopyxis carbonaria]|nr:hypothetical protein EDC01DRAFT_618638 [Geopyxis carbonaria]